MTRVAIALAIILTPSLSTAETTDINALWSKKCAGCHGSDGAAQTPFGKKHQLKDLSTASYQASVTDEQLRKTISEGVSGTKMPAFKGRLSDEEIRGLVTHIRGLKMRTSN